LAIIIWIVIGLIAGWLATQLLGGRDGKLPQNLTLGLVGAVLGGLLFTYLSTAHRPSFFDSLLAAMVGAVVVLVIWRAIRRA
jgi:uncharacterized membrane protein YeaQ/YmgE (transglycosylase-associated protein family)